MNPIYVCHIVLLLVLLWGVKFAGFKGFNEEFMSLNQTKVLQGFFALCIMFHHISQKNAASWINIKYYQKGLDFFVPIGYLCVAVFLFCSGYGLLKSCKSKPGYLKGFLKRRILPLIIVFYMVNLLFFIVRVFMKQEMDGKQIFYYLSGLKMCNPNAWYVIALPIFYLGFYLAFRFVRSEKLALVLTCLVVFAYTVVGIHQDHHDFWMGGEWWYNSVHMFSVGLIFARYEKGIIRHLQKYYWIYLPVMLVLTYVLFALSEMAQGTFSYYAQPFPSKEAILCRWVCLLAQMAASFVFVMAVLLVNMKLTFGNRILRFMGGLTLEFYMIHGLFVEMFCFSFAGLGRGVYYIENVLLFVLVVIVLSVPSAWLLQKWGRLLMGIGKKKEK